MAALGILGGVGLVGVGMTRDSPGAGPVSLSGVFNDRPVAKASPKPTGPSPEELARLERAKRVKALDTALKAYAETRPDFAVAVLDRKTGQRYSFRGTKKYETASVVKVQVLACLLLTAQDDDRELTANERALAGKMIRYSDNDATTSLFRQLGRQSAISACNKRLGLTQTKVNSAWGLTRTTVDDQVKLLAELVDTKGPLTADSREIAQQLMSTVADDQDWGVPAIAKTGEKSTVKNGWLSRSTDNNLYIINTVGRVVGGNTDVSVAVLSHNNQTMDSGIALVEKAAQLTRQHLKY